MGISTRIEWTDATWNPVTGCDKVSQGCKHCYAERQALRLQKMGQANYVNGFKVTLQPQTLEVPLHWKKPKRIFVNSMSDLFHEEVPILYIQHVFIIMREAHWHTFQILTKRIERLLGFDWALVWSDNIWMGVSVEDTSVVSRIDSLRECTAKHKFLSLEPLLGPLDDLDLTGIDWVIVGGETGPDARPMDAAWPQAIRDQCLSADVPFFFKSWGGSGRINCRTIDGQAWEQFPGNNP